MVGAGIFFTTGGFSGRLADPLDIVWAWVLGGVLALAGALSYAELGAMMPNAGGEYHYISRIFGRIPGFLSGFVSLVAGFAAPIGGVAIFFAINLEHLTGPIPTRATACVLIAIVTAVHGFGVRFGAGVNDAVALLKLGLVVVFIVAGFLAAPTAAPVAAESIVAAPGLFSGAFAEALVLVAFAYTGWNAAAYVGGEVRRPGRMLPAALISGTLLVTVLYVLMNLVYLRAAAPAEMTPDIGAFAAKRLFGDTIGTAFTAGLVALLLSTVSAFAMSGPRVTLAMARDGLVPEFLGRVNRRGAPTAAAVLQGLVAIGLVVSVDDPYDLLSYVGLLLSLFSGLAVLGVIVLRIRAPEAPRPFRVPGYPVVPLVFIALAGWMITYSALDSGVGNPWQSPVIASGLTLVGGLLVALALGLGTRRSRSE